MSCFLGILDKIVVHVKNILCIIIIELGILLRQTPSVLVVIGMQHRFDFRLLALNWQVDISFADPGIPHLCFGGGVPLPLPQLGFSASHMYHIYVQNYIYEFYTDFVHKPVGMHLSKPSRFSLSLSAQGSVQSVSKL